MSRPNVSFDTINDVKVIPTYLHGLLDYLTAFTLLSVPRLLGWSQGLRRLLGGAGIATILYSLLTRYEFGLFKLIPMKGHLVLDGAQAILTVVLALLLRREKPATRAALLGLGSFELVVTLTSESEPRVANMLSPLTIDIYTAPAETKSSVQQPVMEQKFKGEK